MFEPLDLPPLMNTAMGIAMVLFGAVVLAVLMARYFAVRKAEILTSMIPSEARPTVQPKLTLILGAAVWIPLLVSIGGVLLTAPEQWIRAIITWVFLALFAAFGSMVNRYNYSASLEMARTAPAANSQDAGKGV